MLSVLATSLMRHCNNVNKMKKITKKPCNKIAFNTRSKAGQNQSSFVRRSRLRSRFSTWNIWSVWVLNDYPHTPENSLGVWWQSSPESKYKTIYKTSPCGRQYYSAPNSISVLIYQESVSSNFSRKEMYCLRFFWSF